VLWETPKTSDKCSGSGPAVRASWRMRSLRIRSTLHPARLIRSTTNRCADLLPERTWRELCLTGGVSTGRRLRHRVARCWLYQRITGLPAGRSVWASDSAEFRTELADLPLWLTAQLHTAVDEYARQFLASCGIHDEPVQWCPDATCTSRVVLPALQPPGLDMAEVRRVLRAEQPRSLARLVRRFDVDLDVLRFLLESEPVPFLNPGEGHPVCGAILKAVHWLPRELFLELYVDHRLSLARIAGIAGVSRHTLTSLAGVYGVPLRRPGRPATSETDLQ
jgi:hypothetical protein